MVRVAVVRLDAADGGSPSGRERARSQATAAVGRAREAGCDVVVLPEYASGWLPHLTIDLAEPAGGAFLTAMRAAAREHRIAVVVGSVRTTAEPGRAVNLTVVIGPEGDVLGGYDKVHRYDAFGARESELLEGGDPARPLVVEVPTGEGPLRVGVVTCYDLRFPESLRALTDLAGPAPDLVAVGAAWAAGEGKAETLRLLVRARAIENTVPVALASQGGWGRVGGAAVVDARGRVLAQTDDGEDCGAPSPVALAVAEVDLAETARVREVLPVLAHRRYRVVPAGE